MLDQDESERKTRELDMKLETRKYYLEIFKISAILAISVVLIWAIFGIVIPKHFELEQEKLDLARYQIEVQADQSNRSIKLQEANGTIWLLEKLLNSGLLEKAANEVLGAPDMSNAAKDLAMELIKTLKVNVECTPRWLCDNKDQKSAEVAANLSTVESLHQKAPANIQLAGNNNKENICFACKYTNESRHLANPG